ncbi:MAG: choline dehydrogenase [Parasphingorhabdus sp.]|jgi:choline dehydrogenase
MRHEAEVVIIGAGSAGCVVAGRLAEAGVDVLLLESGPDYGNFGDPRWPQELVDARMLANSHDWGYAQNRWVFQRARVIGGCSSHNGAIAAVGHRSDYDNWNLPGWSAKDVRPLFAEVLKRMRVNTYARDQAGPFHEKCLQAAEALGWNMAEDLCDLDANESFGLESANIDHSVRWNTSFAYLDPIRHLDNFKIMADVTVDRVSQGDNSVHIFAQQNSENIELVASQVVLAGGVYGTPALLQRSGIGHPQLLRELQIPVQVESKEVGANLHDQPMARADRTVGPELQSWLDEAAATGFLPEEQTLGKALSSQASDGIFDLHLFPICASDQTSQLHGRVHMEVACMTPKSRGQLSIVSQNALVAPSIDHAYLSDEEGHDIAVMKDGLKMAEEFLNHPKLANLLGDSITPTRTNADIRNQVEHYYHPVGTCRMGKDANAVCDADGRVNGVERLLIADASLFPTIPRANTNIPTIMIGERIARSLIQSHYS